MQEVERQDYSKLSSSEDSIEDSKSLSDNAQCELDTTMFSDRHTLELNDVIYHIIKCFERSRLIEMFKDRAELDFSQFKALQIRYKDKKVIDEMKTFLRDMVDEKFTKDEINTRKGLHSCENLRSQLRKKGYFLFKYQGRVLLYGQSKKREQVSLMKEQILAEHFCEVRNLIQEQFSHSQKCAYSTIFKRLRNFDKIIKSSNGVIKSIEPIWTKFQFNKHRRSALHFVVRSKKHLPMKQITDKINDEINSCYFVICILNKFFNSNQIESPRKYATQVFSDGKLNRNYLVIAFRRKEIDTMNALYIIKNFCKQTDSKVEGFRYFQNISKKLKVDKLQSELEAMGYKTELFPERHPYSVSALWKFRDENMDEPMLQLISIARTGKVQGANLSTSKILNNLTVSNQQIQDKADNEDDRRTQISQIPVKAQKQPESDLLYTEMIKKKETLTIQGRAFIRTPIQCSKFLLAEYQQIQDSQTQVAVIGLNCSIMRLSNYECLSDSDYITFIPISEAVQKEDFIVGYLKNDAFSEKSCMAFKASYRLRLQK